MTNSPGNENVGPNQDGSGLPQQQVPILLIDDIESNLIALEAVLSDPAHKLVLATSGQEALHKLTEHEFAVIVSDVRMPVIDGFKFAELAREIPSAQETPIIFLTGDGDSLDRVHRAYASGAVDFLQKPFEPEIVKAKVAVFVRLFRQRILIMDQAKKLYDSTRELEKAQRTVRERELREKELQVKREADDRAARVIRQNEETLRLAFQAGEVGRWSADFKAGLSVWSEEQEKIFGLAPGAFSGRTEDFLAMVHPHDRERMLGRFHEALRNADRIENDYRIIRPDQDIRWLISRGHIDRDGEGNPLRATGVVIDVTKQKESEEALRVLNEQLQVEVNERNKAEGVVKARETQLKLVTDTLPALVAYIDDAHCYQFLNAKYERLFDRPVSEIHGRHVADVLGQPAYEKVKPHLARAAQGETVSFEEHMHYENGKSRWVQATYVPDLDEHRVFKGVVALVHDITERRQAEDDLRMQAKVLDSMIEGVSLSDENGYILYTNPSEDIMFGYDRGELIGKHVTVQNAYSAAENEKIVDSVISQLTSTGTWSGEFTNRRKDGTPFITSARINQIELSGRNFFVCVQEDITDRKRAEEALRSSEERFRLMVEQVEDYGIITTDESGNVVDWNPSIERITGFSTDEVVGKDASIFFTPEDRIAGVPRMELERAKEAGRAEDLRWHMKKDGSRFWAKGYTNALKNADGTLRGFSKILRDETEIKRREDSQRLLDQFTKRIASSIDHQNIIVFLADSLVPDLGDWCAIDIKDRGDSSTHAALRHRDPDQERILHKLRTHYPPGRNPGHPVETVLQSGEPKLLKHIDDDYLRATAQDAHHLELMRQFPTNTAMIVPLMAHGMQIGTLTVGSASRLAAYDPSDLALLDELARRGGLALDNARLYSESKEANRLKDEFLAAVSHELRTPLNSILGFSELLKEDLEDSHSEEIKESIDAIHRNAVSQFRLVEDLLDLSKIISGKMRLVLETFDLEKVVRESVSSMEVSARAKDINLKQTFKGTLTAVTLDPVRVQQIIWNLVSNAVKFTPAQGIVAITVLREGLKVKIEVSDTGKGIDPAFLPFVFDRFRQEDGSLSRLSGGLGLGLAIVKQLVELHGGTIEAQSEGLGRGATFVVELPEKAMPRDANL